MPFTVPNVDDAFAFLVEAIRHDSRQLRERPAADMSLFSVVRSFLVQNGVDPQRAMDCMNDREFSRVWRSFDDAAWRLCRMGVLRPTIADRTQRGGPLYYLGDDFAITTAGAKWLESVEVPFIPSDPDRYTALLERESRVLGRGFLQRAREAASCHQTANYLACCAMAGAAAESAVLAAAIAKTANEEGVLRDYAKRDGRRRLLEMIFEGQSESLRRRYIEAAFSLLAYWRDEAAHGVASDISEIDAFHSLTLLVRLAQFIHTHWSEISAPRTRA